MAPMTLQEISDRIEIDDLLTRYGTAVDGKDWDLYASCFTPDAFIDYTSAGGIKGSLPEVKQWLGEVMQFFPKTHHAVVNREIVLDGDAATGRSIFYNPMCLSDGQGGQVLFIDGGYYNDKFVRTAGGWKIRERIEESTYSTRLQRMPPPGEFGFPAG